MSDLEQYLDMLQRAGIEYRAEGNGDSVVYNMVARTTVHVVGGYYGFYCVHSFDKHGTLISVGAYE